MPPESLKKVTEKTWTISNLSPREEVILKVICESCPLVKIEASLGTRTVVLKVKQVRENANGKYEWYFEE